MFTLNDDLSIYATRGDIVFFSVTAEENGEPYMFKAGDVVRIKVYGKKDAENVVLQKDFPVTEDCTDVEIFLTEEDTKIGDVISKPKDYWYEIELNPYNNPQTIIGYDDDGAKVFKLFPEGDDVPEWTPAPEDIAAMDDELDMTSTKPVQNQAIARAVTSLRADFEETKETITGKSNDTAEVAAEAERAVAVERARIDNLIAHAENAKVSQDLSYLDFISEETKAKIGGRIYSDGVFATISVNLREANLIYGGTELDVFIIPNECRPIALGVIHTYDGLDYIVKYDVAEGDYYLSLRAQDSVTVAPPSAGSIQFTYALGDYELSDIRVGDRGETYGTAGEAVRTQMSAKADAGEIHNAELAFPNVGYIRTEDGTIAADVGAVRTDYLLCKGYNRVEAKLNLAATGYAIAFFDANKNVLEDVSIIGNAEGNQEDYAADIPEGAVFVVFSHYGDKTHTAKLINTENVDNRLAEIGRSIEKMRVIVDSKASAGDIYNIEAEFTLTGYFRTRNGEINDDPEAVRTDYLVCTGYNRVDAVLNMGSAGYAVAFFDEDKNLLPDASVPGNAEGSQETYTVDVPEAAVYVVLAHYGSKAHSGMIANTENVDTKIQAANRALTDDINAIKQRMMDDICASGSFAAFAKWGVIGDSLSVGHTNDTSGTPHGRNIYYSWPQYLARRVGNVCLNLGVTGKTAKTWMSDSKCYNRTIDPDNQCQCYVVALGANDAEQLAKYAGGVGTIADIDFADMNNNADSFYGWYAKVINTVYAVAPNAKIFLFTVPYPRNVNPSVKQINSAIAEMSQNENFRNVALVDLSADYDEYYRANGIANMVVAGHYTAVGYANVSKVNEIALSAVMNRNKADYQDIPFIPFGSATKLD